MRVLVDRRREVLVRGQHASGREQCGGRQGVEGRTHEYIMPWVLASRGGAPASCVHRCVPSSTMGSRCAALHDFVALHAAQTFRF